MRARRISRRTILRGMSGMAVGLPALECMLNANGDALAQGGAIPQRYGIVFAGQAIGGDGYAKNQYRIAGESFTEEGHFIAPAEFGTGFGLTTPLEPLAALTADFSIVSNLAIPFNATSSEAADVPAGGAYRDFHGGGAGPLLCGTRSVESRYTCRSITSDQVIAQLHGAATPAASVVLRAQPKWYLAGSDFAGREFISYTGDREPVEAQSSPQTAYLSLFGGFVPEDASLRAEQEFNLRANRSVLDLIEGKRERILASVSGADRVRLEQHFDQIRSLEQRLATVTPTGPTCNDPGDPGPDSALAEDNAGVDSSEIGTNTGYSDEATRARVMSDLIHMAYVCDLTRVATLQITSFQSHMNVYQPSSDMGVALRADLHEVGHNGDPDNRGQYPVSLMLKWHMAIYAELVQRLLDTPEGAGTVLDNTALVFMPEAGHGLQLNDATTPDQTHSVENMVLLIAGRAGGLISGQHVDGGRAHPAQVLLTAMQAVGYEGDTLGEVSGALPGLRA